VRGEILADWSDERLDALLVKQSAVRDFILPAFSVEIGARSVDLRHGLFRRGC
jgi:hypothetical protein